MSQRRDTERCAAVGLKLILIVLALLITTSPLRAAERSELGPSILASAPTERTAEQGILTPVPVRISLAEGMAARRVLVHYKLWGNKEWTTLQLSPTPGGFAGMIPCLEVSTVTGDLVYYIRIHDGEGAVIAYSGSRSRPYRVKIVHPTERPDLRAGKCPDPSDCPPGFPGCPSEPVARVPCESDADCEGGQTCGWDGFCDSVERERHWFGLALEQAVGIVPGAGVCSVPSQESEGYACYRQSDGANYVGNPVYTNEPAHLARGTTRVLLSYDYVFSYQASIGARVGYAFLGTGPTLPEGTSFFPLLVEARASRWFGADPFARAGLRPYVFGALGAGMFDLFYSVHVREDPTQTSFQGNDLEQTLDVWKRAGDLYVGLGGGLELAVGRGAGPSIELALVQAFPFGATLLLPRAGYRFGF